MRQLSDILIEKVKVVGGKRALAQLLNVTDGAIHQYIAGSMPSLSVAIAWKKSFGENLIEMMFADEPPTVVEERSEPYGLQQKYLATLEKLEKCREQVQQVTDEQLSNAIVKALAEFEAKQAEIKSKK